MMVMTVTAMGMHCRRRGAGLILERAFQIALELRERALRLGEIPRRQCAAKSLPVILNWIVGIGFGAGTRRTELLQGVIGGLGSAQITGLERLGELIEILQLLLEGALHGLQGRDAGRDAGNRHAGITSCEQAPAKGEVRTSRISI